MQSIFTERSTFAGEDLGDVLGRTNLSGYTNETILTRLRFFYYYG